MRHWYQRPTPLLSDYVRTVLVMEGFSQPDRDPLPLFTNGMPAFLCQTEKDDCGNEQVVQLSLHGRSASEECWLVNQSTTIIAYFFKPFMLATVFKVAANKLLEDTLDFTKWHPHPSTALKLQLAYAPSTQNKISVLDHLLVQQVNTSRKECDVVSYATDQMMLNPETDILGSILEKLKLSERSFQRTFKKYVGVTPVLYRRICQFEKSFTQLRSNDFTKLTDVAYDNGFADQSHFIRSFREFTQTTPNSYLRFGLKEKD